MIFADHWPKSVTTNMESDVSAEEKAIQEIRSSEVINFSESRRRAYLSLYHGDFTKIGQRLKVLTNNFEDFTLLMNVPYGY
jgi:hypothetical protein